MADPYAANPALDDLRASSPAAVQAAMASGEPVPTLFATGDVPPFTASGNDPRHLLRLPWQLRHAAARADQREWARLFSEYSKGVPDADVAATFEPAAQDSANGDYIGRVQRWAAYAGSPSYRPIGGR